MRNKSDKDRAKLNRLSEIFSGLAQVVFASVIIPFVIDKFDFTVVILGLITAIFLYTLSIFLAYD